MKKDLDYFRELGRDSLPGHLGVVVTSVSPTEIRLDMPVTRHLMAPNGFLHAGSVISLADSACGYGCIANLPDKAKGFTTIELKSNHLGTVRDGNIYALATPVHLGKTTQVWDANVFCTESGKRLAVFRCTQMILY